MLVLTLIANPNTRDISQELIREVAQLIGEPSPNWLGENCACEFTLSSNDPSMRTELDEIVAEAPIDQIIQPAENRRKRALIADMDSTMIDQECIDELAAELGLKEKVATITAKAMNGELEFETAVKERVSLLKGLNADISEQIIENRITLASGGKTLVQTMKANGAYCALVSGGFTSFTSSIANMLGFDENRANVLEEENGRLTGLVREPILGAEAKVTAMNEIAADRKLSPNDFVAVGDGANDLPMLKLAGMGVALHAKPSVAQQSSIRIDHGDLTALLYLQGYREGEFQDG